MTIEQLAVEVEKGLGEREWFVSGNIDASLFSDSFVFSDDTVSIKDSGRGDGLRRYALGVRKLFDQSRSRAQVIGVEVEGGSGDRKGLLVKWRLEGGVNIGPFRPQFVPYLIDTTLSVNEVGLITSQVDRFLVPGILIVLGALFGPWAGPAPAPPIETLRAQFKRSQ